MHVLYLDTINLGSESGESDKTLQTKADLKSDLSGV